MHISNIVCNFAVEKNAYLRKKFYYMIQRPVYIKKLIERKNNGLIKVITGLRRSGKSILLSNLYHDYLRDSGIAEDHIIQIDLEDILQYEYRDPRTFLEYVYSKITDDSGYYLFVDEIQHLDQFEGVLNSLIKHRGVDVYVTGSNSKFLSTDVITEFRGRGDEVRIYPLSFQEIVSSLPQDHINLEALFLDYMVYGGMPFLTTMKLPEQKEEYLKNLFKETYLKDIRDRYKIQNDSDLEELIDVLASAVGSMQNPLTIQNTFRSVKKHSLSDDTIKLYLQYLEEAFLVEKSVRYDIKGRSYISTPSKFYFGDVGLRNARLNFRQTEPTHLMENIIYNELRRRGLSVDVGQVIRNTRNAEGVSTRQILEVDFVCNRGYKRSYIQSAWSLPDEEKMQQETRSLKYIKDSFQKIIIVGGAMRPTYQTEDGILVMSIYDFLLKPELLNM